MRPLTWSFEDLEKAVEENISLEAVLRFLNLKLTGGNRKTVSNYIKLLELDISHFKGQGWAKGRAIPRDKTPLSEILVDCNYTTNSHRIKLRLIDEGLFERKCYNCNLQEWLGNPIPIELDHINGVNHDYRIGNLTILCPNCHALTPTYRAKNVRVAK